LGESCASYRHPTEKNYVAQYIHGSTFFFISKVERPNTKKINFGIKAGFNSSMFMVSELKIKDVTTIAIQPKRIMLRSIFMAVLFSLFLLFYTPAEFPYFFLPCLWYPN